jgi:hypothetical protein
LKEPELYFLKETHFSKARSFALEDYNYLWKELFVLCLWKAWCFLKVLYFSRAR